MAGDWIKMRTNLRRHPRVIAMARQLSFDREFMNWWTDPQQMTCRDAVTEVVTFENVTRVTVCGLLEVWGAVNAVIKSSEAVDFMTIMDLDDIAGIPGFGVAMEAVGWVSEDDENGLTFNNFSEFNTPDSERKKPKTDAQRAREYRERKKRNGADKEQDSAASRTSQNVTGRREEKSRSKTSSTPDGREKISMAPDWTPSDGIAARMTMAGIPAGDLTQESLGEFKSYWLTRSDQLTQSQWEHKLIQALQSRRRNTHAAGSRSSKNGHDRDSVESAIEDTDDRSWAEGVN
ncbi:DnaT-like ssDNA-binding domain-containing protein [Marinobacter sp. Hex_13]|uniref:DnaT-like ssDNA-binding domain-containing protein n=1 Tax=Marinobacter sp. Hex_13 TaxID=1795866 RepID=UPI0007997124|nr:DnaT-like ssDNA-binding domain-containing protein [Marinobacter sp. Hex_13]KXJ45864.1 MAG: hypothetical protein AXW11_12295 [Marinobacter sp. Hex_13]